MGKSDIAIKQWLSNVERFADLCNAVIFGGVQVVSPKDLEPMEGESAIIVSDKEGEEKGFQRFRDIVMRWGGKLEFVVLACENQESVHYAMPIRNMFYDSLSYIGQMRQIWNDHKKSGNKMTGEEFLSQFKKDDKLRPVITLVFYFGDRPWDGSVNVYDMLELDEKTWNRETMEKFIPNYHINLVDAARIKDTGAFVTDLQLIIGMLKYRNQKEALMKYVDQNREYFSKLDLETFQAVQAFLNSEKRLEKAVHPKERQEAIDMCKALEDLYEEGIEKGEIRGMILAYRDMDMPDQEIAVKFMDKYGITQDDALRMLEDCK